MTPDQQSIGRVKKLLRDTREKTIRVEEVTEDLLKSSKGAARLKGATKATVVHISETVEVEVRDGCLRFWEAEREVRVGPLAADQAEKLAEELEYEAVRARGGPTP